MAEAENTSTDQLVNKPTVGESSERSTAEPPVSVTADASDLDLLSSARPALEVVENPPAADPVPLAEDPAPEEAPAGDGLADQLSEIRELLRSEQKARAEAESRAQAEAEQARQLRENARRDLLEKLGLVKWDYQTLAPTADDADPFTEEGRRKYAKFRRENETLFKGSPEPPAADQTLAPTGKPRTWRALFADTAKGITR